MKTLLFLATLSLLSVSLQAAEPTELQRLGRLSRVVRGYAPSFAEREALRKAKEAGQAEAFLQNKTDEYLNSQDHVNRMVWRLEELFRVRTDATPLYKGPLYQRANLYGKTNALGFLFTDVVKQNSSWDRLLTGKSYRLFQKAKVNSIGFSDDTFMKFIVPDFFSYESSENNFSGIEPENPPLIFRDVEFAQTDARIAGSITTSRFFNRYSNTGLNKNRKRAAAIFRIFLCDSMTAAIPDTKGQEEEIYDLMFPHAKGMTEQEIRAAANGNDKIHGTRADCMACHSKLDPMGRTLMTSGMLLAPRPVAGALSFPNSEGKRTEVSVSGIGGIGQAITEQPEYVACQVRHFWDWFIGDRVKLTPAKATYLQNEFRRVGRKTNDFVKVILAQPEFSSITPPMTELEIRANQVRGFLKRCQDCHKDQFYDGSPDGSFADFTKWPIGGDASEAKSWLRKISRQMDLEHDGEKPKMPPTDAAWRTNFVQMELIKNWIKDGAPNEKGERMIEP